MRKHIKQEIRKTTGEEWEQYNVPEKKAIAFATENINPEPPEFIDDAEKIHSLEYVLAHHGGVINTQYRKGKEHIIDNDILKIPDMIARHTAKVPFVAYRGVNENVLRQMVENARDIEETDLLDKAFLQTSLVKGQESSANFYLRIFVPEGTQVVYLGNVNLEQNSYEVVIQCCTKLKIVSYDDKYINCEIVQ